MYPADDDGDEKVVVEEVVVGVVGATLLTLLPDRLCDFALPVRRDLVGPSIHPSLYRGGPEARASFSMDVIQPSILDMGSAKTSASPSSMITGSSAGRLEDVNSVFFVERRAGSDAVELVEDRRRSTIARVFDACRERALLDASARKAGRRDAEGRLGVAVRVESLLNVADGGEGISM